LAEHPSSSVGGGASKEQLEEAFALFIEASKAIEAQQTQLQSEIQRLSNDLAQANQRLTDLLQALPTGVILVENGVIADQNLAAQTLVGLAIGQAWQTPASWLPTPMPGEYQTSTDSTARTVKVTQLSLAERQIVQIQDITDSLRLHIESQRQSKLASMGQMAASIAHQLRTPLATATLYAGNLGMPNLSPDKQKEALDRLRKQLASLETLTTQMLQFVRQRPQKTEMVSGQALLDEALAAIGPMCEKRNIGLRVQASGLQALVNVERPTMVAAMVAILENALQVSQDAGEIVLTGQSDGARLQFVVDDAGPGIPNEMMASLFEPFATSRINGTGLGLSIARNAVEAHRGEILASNRADGGARFSISIPCIAEFS
jgi:two-component system sensor histidine kinase FlrB